MNVLITGVSSGLGQSLMRSFINKGHEVYGLSRNKVDECHHICCDLADLNSIEGKLNRLLDEVSQLDLVILNAGMLGNIKTIDNWSLNELTEIMNINVWSNKVLLDWILNNKKVSQVLAISSGASNHTYKGWSGYSLSKSALNMMMDVYSKDTEGIHFISVAPGLVSTSMQDYLCNEVDENKFPVTKKFIAARKDGSMKTPDQIAEKFVEMLPQFQTLENGTFIDLRDIN
jgi:NAD(P)-dependent dehydrogenase (short-subunit alcohol dehydrogenase family)|tara:strand:- start:434 stop:1123 length:690 start_codon:yes stop_codon:yes gene_type:complete